ncbi:MAG: hypothetical protein LUC97_09930 [Clostridiales bacterium]|nr:hypothetical protein [Clostridiales bacterium]
MDEMPENYERNIYNLLREQFDRVIYVLSKEIDIKMTNKTSEKMFKSYVASENCLYLRASL